MFKKFKKDYSSLQIQRRIINRGLMMLRQVKILLIIVKEVCPNQAILQKMKLIKHLKH